MSVGMKSRVDEAVKLFESGYNCCQAVFATYSDIFGIDRETALKMTNPMGGGVAKMREVCGTVNAIALLTGLRDGNADADNQEAKTRIYDKVQQMASQFKYENGSIVCRQLLGELDNDKNPAPSVRTPEYYGTRPCSKFVADAANIVESMLIDDLID